MKYKDMSVESLEKEKEIIFREISKYKSMDINLAMARGIPNSKVIELTASKFSNIDVYSNRIYKDGTDIGTYDQGLIAGIKEMKLLFSELLDVDEDNLIVGGNSSLNLMFDLFFQMMLKGNCDSLKPWGKEEKIKFLCPVPGYDRHFAICEYMGIDMLNIPMSHNGPDMDLVEKLAASDSMIKGIWCVPLYSNPGGNVYSDEIIERLASMETAAVDFRIFWDNAYSVHHLFNGELYGIKNIVKACKNAGNDNRVYMFASTSKISMPGSGVSAIAASEMNIKDILNRMRKQTIGYDKMNMIRHSIAFPDKDSVMGHMRNIAKILKPNFDITLEILDNQLSGLGIAEWTHPKGGYFISFFAMQGCAKKIVELCASAGVRLTPAGATYPYKNDPDDSNIRIAPTFPSYDDMKTAAKIFCACVKQIALEKLTGEA